MNQISSSIFFVVIITAGLNAEEKSFWRLPFLKSFSIFSSQNWLAKSWTNFGRCFTRKMHPETLSQFDEIVKRAKDIKTGIVQAAVDDLPNQLQADEVSDSFFPINQPTILTHSVFSNPDVRYILNALEQQKKTGKKNKLQEPVVETNIPQLGMLDAHNTKHLISLRGVLSDSQKKTLYVCLKERRIGTKKKQDRQTGELVDVPAIKKVINVMMQGVEGEDGLFRWSKINNSTYGHEEITLNPRIRFNDEVLIRPIESYTKENPEVVNLIEIIGDQSE